MANSVPTSRDLLGRWPAFSQHVTLHVWDGYFNEYAESAVLPDQPDPADAEAMAQWCEDVGALVTKTAIKAYMRMKRQAHKLDVQPEDD